MKNNQPVVKQLLPEFSDPSVLKVFLALSQAGGKAMVAGGAVRDMLLGLEVNDIDFATDLKPEAVIEAGRAAGFSVIPTGLEHGTVTLRDSEAEKQFEVTTLRVDAVCDGRHAEVEFTDSWQADAERRDFSVNALFADEAGNVVDYVGGIADLGNKVLRFVGNAEDRITEDFLRILRLFRFAARFGFEIDTGAPGTVRKHAAGLESISRERIREEFVKMLAGPDPLKAVKMMERVGVLDQVIPATSLISSVNATVFLNKLLNRNAAHLANMPSQDVFVTLLASLLDFSQSADVLVPACRRALVLTNAEAKLLRDIMAVSNIIKEWKFKLMPMELVKIAFRHGREPVLGALLLWGTGHNTDSGVRRADARFADCFKSLSAMQLPVMPVNGNMLIDKGLAQGKEIGAALASMTKAWLESDFRLTADELLANHATA